MPNKIDELFSPEHLRKNWQKTKKNSARPVSPATDTKSPLDIFSLLQILVKGRFWGEDVAVLNLLLGELLALLITVFPPPENDQTPAETIPAIHDVLNRLEDIIEAFEIAGRGR